MDVSDDEISDDYSVTSLEWSDEENNYKEIKVSDAKKTEGRKEFLVPAGASSSCREHLVRTVGGLYKSPQFSDIVIHCRGGKLPAHRLLLAGQSLRSLLTQDPDIADIFLLDFDVSSVAIALQLLYTGSIIVNHKDITSVNQIMNLLGLAKYDVIELKEGKKKKERQKLKVKHEKNLGSRRITQEPKAVLSRKKRVFMASLDPADLTCDICQKSFPALYKLKIHQLIHSESFPFMCMNCGKGFNNKYKMHAHEKKRLCESEQINPVKVQKPPKIVNLNIYNCNDCPMTFSLVKDLKKHVQLTHRVKTQLTCVHCSTVCRSQKTLIAHLKVVHNDHESGLKCTCGVCGKKFPKLSNLEDHILRHSDIKQFGCMYCPKRCATKQDLDRHLRSHSGEATFICQFCQRTFVHRKTYTNHLRKHLGQKPYHCKPCNKSFAALTYLKKHQLSHQRKGDATKIVTAKKSLHGTTSLSYIDHLTAPEDALEAALIDSKLLDGGPDPGVASVYIPGRHYVQTGGAGASVTPLVVTDYTEVGRVSNYDTGAKAGDTGGGMGNMFTSSMYLSKNDDIYKSDHHALSMDNNPAIMPGNNDDDNSQDDGYLMELFEHQPSATETTLKKL